MKPFLTLFPPDSRPHLTKCCQVPKQALGKTQEFIIQPCGPLQSRPQHTLWMKLCKSRGNSLFPILSGLALCPVFSRALWSQSLSAVSDLLPPHGLYSPWDSPGQNTGVGSVPFSRGSSQPRVQTQVSHIAGGYFTSWATREAQEY